MAIAVLPDQEWLESPWPQPILQPQPMLRLVEPPTEEISSALPTWEEAEKALPVRTGVEVSVRRQVRTSRRVRCRRAAAAILVAGLLVLLALPISALGGRPAAHHPSPPSPGSAGHQVTYVVQPGDTLWSIASRLDRGGDPRPLVRELATRIGSDAVYPGERIVVP